MNKFLVGVCTIMELGCITALAAIGLKRNKDAYNAEMKAIELECKLWAEETIGELKDAKIEELQKELDKLKAQLNEES